GGGRELLLRHAPAPQRPPQSEREHGGEHHEPAPRRRRRHRLRHPRHGGHRPSEEHGDQHVKGDVSGVGDAHGEGEAGREYKPAGGSLSSWHPAAGWYGIRTTHSARDPEARRPNRPPHALRITPSTHHAVESSTE